MTIKSRVKSLLLGAPGPRPRRISRGVLRGAMFTVDTSSKSMRLLGLDEAEIAGWMRRLAANASVAVDVGANDGWYSVYFALQPNIQRVLAFEPDDRLHDTFRQNLALNGDEVVRKCLLTPLRVGAIDDARTATIDTVLAGEDRSAVIKIDVEGAELDVLKGAKHSLQRMRCGVIVETHAAHLERECQAFLQELGYQARVVRRGWYRALVPENRNIPHNRWLAATKK